MSGLHSLACITTQEIQVYTRTVEGPYTFTFALSPTLIFAHAIHSSLLLMSYPFIHRGAALGKGKDDNTATSMAAVMAENEVPTNTATIKPVASTHAFNNVLAVFTSPSCCASSRRPQN